MKNDRTARDALSTGACEALRIARGGRRHWRCRAHRQRCVAWLDQDEAVT